MNCSSRFVVRFLGVASAALALVLASCTSGEGSDSKGSSGPTVKVSFDSQPTAALIVNGTDLGITPVSLNLPVDETTGFLVFDLNITFDPSKVMGGGKNAAKGSSTNSAVTWRAGKHLPLKVTMINGNANESREYAPANPPGTRSQVERQ
jgi:hypothetical protein